MDDRMNISKNISATDKLHTSNPCVTLRIYNNWYITVTYFEISQNICRDLNNKSVAFQSCVSIRQQHPPKKNNNWVSICPKWNGHMSLPAKHCKLLLKYTCINRSQLTIKKVIR